MVTYAGWSFLGASLCLNTEPSTKALRFKRSWSCAVPCANRRLKPTPSVERQRGSVSVQRPHRRYGAIAVALGRFGTR